MYYPLIPLYAVLMSVYISIFIKTLFSAEASLSHFYSHSTSCPFYINISKYCVLQLANSSMDYNPSYDSDKASGQMPSSFHDIGDVEFQDNWGRVW